MCEPDLTVEEHSTETILMNESMNDFKDHKTQVRCVQLPLTGAMSLMMHWTSVLYTSHTFGVPGHPTDGNIIIAHHAATLDQACTELADVWLNTLVARLAKCQLPASNRCPAPCLQA